MSQSAELLKMLQKAGKKGVPNYKFPERHILRYSARIADLRKQGFNIPEPERQRVRGRLTGVYVYRLVDNE